ncbi:MAG: dihydroneopterin aldolase [Gammaproteobacteria bacterium]|jgi:dihydroneopterin aldolase|nr:dihydroneopterin aldolase [Gammaproteobacteria bacterium]
MDKIVISDIKLNTIIGVYDWEKQASQNIHLDIALSTDAKKIAATDDLSHAIDYSAVIKHIFDYVQTNHFQLIETLAEKLATEVLQHFSTEWVQITLHKPGALLQAKDVSITIERTK